MPSPEPESVFRMGVEGGGVDFFRQWNADGTAKALSAAAGRTLTPGFG